MARWIRRSTANKQTVSGSIPLPFTRGGSLFPTYEDFDGGGGGVEGESTIHSLPALFSSFFLSGDQVASTNIPLFRPRSVYSDSAN